MIAGTLNGLETDPLARAVNDEVYLTRLYVPAPPTIPIKSDSMEHTQIIKAIAETELQRYISEGVSYFLKLLKVDKEENSRRLRADPLGTLLRQLLPTIYKQGFLRLTIQLFKC